MKKKIINTVGAVFAMALVTGMSSCIVNAASGNYTNSDYSYVYKTDGNHKDTQWRNKNCDISNDGIHGYGYIMNSYMETSRVQMYGRNDSSTSSAKVCSSWGSAEHYKHTNINNSFKKSVQNQAKLRITTPSGTSSTYGVWSPDSSKQYSNIIG